MNYLYYSIYLRTLNLIKITIFEKKIIDHITVQFVDDGSNVIALKDHIDIKSYTESHFNLLYDHCTANKLKFNPDKTKFIIICKKSMRRATLHNRVYKEYTT